MRFNPSDRTGPRERSTCGSSPQPTGRCPNASRRAPSGTICTTDLNVIHLTVPPLRERGRDILLLLNHFLAEFAKSHGSSPPRLTEPAQDALLAYHWPGNIRELKNLAEHIVVRAGDRSVDSVRPPGRGAGHVPRSTPPGIAAEAPPGEPAPAERAWNQMVARRADLLDRGLRARSWSTN